MTTDRDARNRRHWDRVLDPQNLSKGNSPRASLRDELPHWDSTEQRWAARRLEPLVHRRTLELGGGLGVGALAYARRGARVVLFDISLRRAQAARRELLRASVADRVDIVVGAAEHMPFRAGAFHRVATKAVLIHTDLPKASREVHRVLRPGGRAIILEPLDSHPGILLYRLLLAPKEWKSITRYWNRARVETFARPFGGGAGGAVRLRFFHFFGVITAFFTYGRFRNRTLRRLCESILDPIDARLIEFLPWLRWWCWFIGVEATHRPQIEGRNAATRAR